MTLPLIFLLMGAVTSKSVRGVFHKPDYEKLALDLSSSLTNYQVAASAEDDSILANLLAQDVPLPSVLASQDAEASPNLYEGDMAGVSLEASDRFRLGLRWDVFPERRWDNNTVPYHISPLYSPKERKLIETAIYTLNTLTCVKFVPYDNQTDWILIWPVPFPKGCWSFVGKIGGQQILSLQRPEGGRSNCLAGIGKPMHEMMHALGIFHEQGRQDRDDHIEVRYRNIIEAFRHNFDKYSPENTTYVFNYDTQSIMHYGSTYFSIDPDILQTITPKDKSSVVGQRVMLTTKDCLKINHLYGCLDDEFHRIKYASLCYYLGIDKKKKDGPSLTSIQDGFDHR